MKSCKPVQIALAVLLVAALPVSACINEIGTNHRGQTVEPFDETGENLKPYLLTPSSKQHLMYWAKIVIKNAKERPTPDNQIDLSAVLIRFGRFPEAIKLLQYLEAKAPGRFEVAANMGTAYELMGRNEDALKWLKEGVRRNPHDHDGTEWLHLRVLEAKLGMRPNAPAGQSILGMDFGTSPVPSRPSSVPNGNDGKPLSLYRLAHALRYQLRERIEFVPAPDPIVAGLLLDWANLELLAGTVESADVLYDAALRYGSKEGKIIALRKAEIARVLASVKGKPRVNGNCELCEPPREE